MDLSGKIVFASGRAADFDIWSLDLKSGALLQLTQGENLNDYPRWSLDGSKIAFISIQADMTAALWTMDANGSNKKRLTQNIYCEYPAWSPDGISILFVGNAGNADQLELFTIPATGGAPKSLFSRDGIETQPCWAPDGKSILFSAPESVDQRGLDSRNTDIFEYVLASNKTNRLTTHPAPDVDPRVSPDGKLVAFVSHRSAGNEEAYAAHVEKIKASVEIGDMHSVDDSIKQIQAMDRKSDVWLMDRNGGNQRALTNTGDHECGIAWSPCGRYLICACSSKNNAERLRVIEVATGKSKGVHYDRKAIERDIHADEALNQSFFQLLIPNVIERRFAPRSFWGEERNPDWTK